MSSVPNGTLNPRDSGKFWGREQKEKNLREEFHTVARVTFHFEDVLASMFTSWVTKFNSLLFESVNIRIIDPNKALYFLKGIGKAFYMLQIPSRN